MEIISHIHSNTLFCVIIEYISISLSHFMISMRIFFKIFSTNMGSWVAPLDSFARSGSHTLMPAKTATAHSYQIMLSALKRKVALPTENMDEMMQLKSDSSKKIAVEPAKMFKNIAPNVSGMGLKDAIYFLEYSGLQVQVKGKGRVVSQSIAPGTIIYKGQNIILQLS